MKQASSQYVEGLESEVRFWPQWKGERYHGVLLHEAMPLRDFWHVAHRLQDGYTGIWNDRSGWMTRRQSLGLLRDLVGREAWERGDWPPPVPVWRFERVDP